MAKLLYVAALLLSLSMVFAGDAAADADTAEAPDSSSTEGKAGEAIKTLLQEKISHRIKSGNRNRTQKFKEAANEVKGVLVKQLGDSLKSAHDVFKQRDKNKVSAATAAKASGKAGKYQIKTAKKRHGQLNSLKPEDKTPQVTAKDSKNSDIIS